MLLFIFALLLAALIFLVVKHYAPLFFNKNLPPGDFGLPILGDTLEYVTDPYGLLTRKFKQYGPIFKAHIFFRPTVFVGTIKGVKDISRQERHITESSLPYAIKELFGKGMSLNLPWGPELKHQRKMFAQSTSHTLQQSYARMAIEVAQDVIPKYNSTEEEKAVDISSLAMEFGFLWGSDAFLGKRLPSSLIQKVKDFSEGFSALIAVDNENFAFGKAMQGARDLEKIARASIEQNVGKSEEEIDSFISIVANMTNHAGGSYSDWHREHACFLWLWAALEQVGANILGVLVNLHKNPDELERVLQETSELRTILRKGVSEAGIEGILKNDYLDSTIKESQRVLPAMGGGWRLLSKPLRIDEYDIPSGWVASVEPRVMNQDPNLFPEPEKFAPQRFYEDKVKTGAFVPGGIGVHACPGMKVGREVVKVALLFFLDQYDFSFKGELKFKQMPFRYVEDTPLHIKRRAGGGGAIRAQ